MFPNPIAALIRNNPSVVKSSILGRLTTGVMLAKPSQYNIEKYQEKEDKGIGQNVRIMFSGLHDNNEVRYAEKALRKRYAGSTIYVFGHDQLQDALDFAETIQPNKRVTVYGYSWGGDDARQFINRYQGNIKAAHFLDPVRKDYQNQKILKLDRDVHTTFTPAGPYQKGYINDIKQATIDALRFQPSLKFARLPKVKDHVALDQWLDNVVKYQRKNKLHKKASLLAAYIRNNPKEIEYSRFGQRLLKTLNKIPSDYNTQSYQDKLKSLDPSKPIKIFFSGFPDSQYIGFSRRAMQDVYGPQNLFMFGHKQLPQAIKLAEYIDHNIPIEVYGYSWGSNAAKNFIDKYKGKIKAIHFLDPMRKTPSQDPILSVSKKTGIKTYTPAKNAHGKIDAALNDVLRYRPDSDFQIYPIVSQHRAIAEYLRQLKNRE